MEFKPHEYQQYCINQIIEKPKVGLFLEMGLGKTVITLTAVREMIGMDISKVLVIAPLRVAQSGWAQEAQKWDHLTDLRVVRMIGQKKEREAALRADADVYVINRENVQWLVSEHERDWPFDMVVIDELSSFKNSQSVRFKMLRRVLHRIDRVVGLTGTPAPNGLMDLWSEMYLLDGGERLGRFIGRYREAFFSSVILPSTGVVIKYKPKPGAEEKIYKRISDICVSMKAVDHIKLPERVDNVVEVELSEEAKKRYLEMEQDMLVKLSEEETVTAVNAAVVTGKLLQMADGGLYGEDGVSYWIHDCKLDALEDIVESAVGKPVLVYYGYRFDLDRIKERLGDRVVELESEKEVERWNRGEIEVLCAHPASAGHGLNLQAGGHIMVWYGLPWSLEGYQQACARLHRQGQTETVIIHHIVAKGTVDEDVMRSLNRKAAGQDALMSALRARMSLHGIRADI